MGVYLYTFRNRPKTVYLCGVPVKVYPLTYATKLHYDNLAKDDRTALAAHARFEAVKPDYYVLDVFEDNAPVYENPTKGYWYDTDKVPGTLLGKLKKVGRKWTMVNADKPESTVFEKW